MKQNAVVTVEATKVGVFKMVEDFATEIKVSNM